MTDKTLSKARGLNSIADPRSFKGSSGRRRSTETEQAPQPSPVPATPEPLVDRADPHRSPDTPQHATPPPPPPPAPAASPAPAVVSAPVAPAPVEPSPAPPREEFVPSPVPAAASPPHRAVNPGINRKRRELSVPHLLADALERTGINPADVVMAAFRKHSNAIYAGEGGRMMAKGRTRLRLSISDAEFEQLTRLGQARGWNRSETVSVILALELLGQPTTPSAAVGP